MIVNVHMRGRPTVFQFASRRDLVKVLPRDDKTAEEFARPKVTAWVKHYGDVVAPGWRQVTIRSINRGAIDSILDAEAVAESEDDLPAKAAAEQRQRNWEERQKAEEESA